MKNAITIVALLVIGSSALWAASDGLQAITAEGARRLSIEEKPKPLPAVLLRDQQGEVFSLQDYQGKNLLVEFIYTRCVTLCTSLGETFEQIAEQLPEDPNHKAVKLLSISFDPRDRNEELQEYGERYDADPSQWRVASVENAEQLQQLLGTFGITVIPDQWGNFEHNAAVHFVNAEGYLDKIVDHDPASISMEVLWKRL